VRHRGAEGTFNSAAFVIYADGGQAVNLTQSGHFDGWPARSPDGRRIVFSREREGTIDMYIVELD